VNGSENLKRFDLDDYFAFDYEICSETNVHANLFMNDWQRLLLRDVKSALAYFITHDGLVN